MNWFTLAIMASALWGLSYTVNELVLGRLSVWQMLWLDSLFMFVCCNIALAYHQQAPPLKELWHDRRLMWLCLLVMSVHVLASFSVLASIKASHATLAAAIEAAYPIFTVLFGWLIFKRFDLSMVQYIGMACILLGVALMK
jgi:drug/metabolite transporter (DMT)-like permease